MLDLLMIWQWSELTIGEAQYKLYPLQFYMYLVADIQVNSY
jgi:hypothetical protein